MSQAVHRSDQLGNDAKRYAGIDSRSVPKQIEYWSRIGTLLAYERRLRSRIVSSRGRA
jgi:ParD-like antitoxin of type II bacterial toxin-antitoxin system